MKTLIIISTLFLLASTSSILFAKESNAVTLITLSNMDSYIKQNSSDKPLVINLSSTNKECKPCLNNNRSMTEAVKNLQGSWNIATIYINPWQNIFKQKEFVKKYKISGMPTTLIFHKNELLASQSGYIGNTTKVLKQFAKRKNI